MASIQVARVDTLEGWNDFVQLPFDLYSNDPNWVPPIRESVPYALSTDKNPFYRHAYRIPLVAYENGTVVGRIVGIIDDTQNREHREAVVSFGFFECVERIEVARALIDAVVEWGKNRGMLQLRGPLSPSMNYECGMLVEGFQDAPTIGMPHQPPYYMDFLNRLGFKKSRDLYAYTLVGDAKSSDRILAHSEKLKENSAVTFRPIRMGEFDAEITRLMEIYDENDSWEKGQVPLSPDEFRAVASRLKPWIDPRIFLIAEVRGELAGFSFALPDLNGALKRNSSGKLWPLGWLKLLWNLKGPGQSSALTRYRSIFSQVRKKFHPLGIEAIIDLELQRRSSAAGYQSGEIAWVSETAAERNEMLEFICGKRTKVYRLYERSLG